MSSVFTDPRKDLTLSREERGHSSNCVSSSELDPLREGGHSLKPMVCHRCGADVRVPIKIYDWRFRCWSNRDCAYTYFFGKLTCIPCYRELTQLEISS